MLASVNANRHFCEEIKSHFKRKSAGKVTRKCKESVEDMPLNKTFPKMTLGSDEEITKLCRISQKCFSLELFRVNFPLFT